MMDLQENLQQVEANICKACENAGRKRSDVTLIAVSKTSQSKCFRQYMILGRVILGRIKFRKCVEKWKFFQKISAGI